ncbi:MAG: NUDIX hydrolase, partial [Pseudomonadota bacterium]
MRLKSPRLAVRGILIEDARLLMVNAYPDGQSALMCAPGGGVEVGSSLPDNLVREMYEETGLRVQVGAPCLVNEFHDPGSGFHQVDVYFHCTLAPAGARVQ